MFEGPLRQQAEWFALQNRFASTRTCFKIIFKNRNAHLAITTRVACVEQMALELLAFFLNKNVRMTKASGPGKETESYHHQIGKHSIRFH